MIAGAVVAFGMTSCGALSGPAAPNQTAGSSPLTIRRDQNGTYTEGPWTYVYTITNPGTRSQGAVGRLLYDGRSLPAPANPADWYDTPLGRFFYASEGKMLWEERGWLPAGSAGPGPGGRALSPPSAGDLIQRAREEMAFLLVELTAREAGRDWQEERPEQEEWTGKTDPWGTKYRVWPDLRSAEGGGMVSRLVIESAGPDRVFGTADDLSRRSAFVRYGSGTEEGPRAERPRQPAAE